MPAHKRAMHPIFKWFRGTGCAAMFFGWGGLLLAGLFWPGVVAISIGFVLLAIDLFLEPDLKQRPFWRWSGLAVIAVLALSFARYMVFIDATLGVSAMVTDAEYEKGKVFSGITWRPEFTEMNIDIHNSSGRTYEDIAIKLRPDLPIAAISHPTGCLGTSVVEDANHYRQRMMDIDLDTGNKQMIPLDLIATDAGYQVSCAKLPHGATLNVVVALADIKWNPAPHPPFGIPLQEAMKQDDYIFRMKMDDFSTYWLGHPDADVYTPRQTAHRLKVEGEYTVLYRKESISKAIDIGGNIQVMRQR